MTASASVPAAAPPWPRRLRNAAAALATLAYLLAGLLTGNATYLVFAVVVMGVWWALGRVLKGRSDGVTGGANLLAAAGFVMAAVLGIGAAAASSMVPVTVDNQCPEDLQPDISALGALVTIRAGERTTIPLPPGSYTIEHLGANILVHTPNGEMTFRPSGLAGVDVDGTPLRPNGKITVALHGNAEHVVTLRCR